MPTPQYEAATSLVRLLIYGIFFVGNHLISGNRDTMRAFSEIAVYFVSLKLKMEVKQIFLVQPPLQLPSIIFSIQTNR